MREVAVSWTFSRIRVHATLILLPVISGCVTKRIREDERPPVIIAPPRPSTDSVRTPEQPDIPRDPAPRLRVEGARDVRVALATAAQGAVLSASGAWRLFDAHDAVLIRAGAGDAWTLERRGRQLRAVHASRGATPWTVAQLTLRPGRDDSYGVFAGHRYRGSLRVVASDTGLVVVNVLPVEEYLRGVVSLEIGSRAPGEQAAVEAQAIAARSYAYARLAAIEGNTSRNESFDVLPSVADQVYGGVDVERPFSDKAVDATSGLVLMYGGRVVSAPYFSSCGGETASPEEVWRTTAEPYLRRVSDRVPGTSDRYYCDIAPRFAWTRTFSGDELDAALRSYLRAYVAVPSGGPGRVRGVVVETRTPSGRVGHLTITTDRGSFSLRGNEVRSVLRAPGGELLNSTYFNLESESRADGSLSRLVIHGNGYGHGIGMCQWGAIGRARAGQTARVILETYYPGTKLGRVD